MMVLWVILRHSRARRGRPGGAFGPAAWPPRAGHRLRLRRARLRRAAGSLGDGQLRRRAVARSLPGAVGARHSLQLRPRPRQLRDRLRRRARAGADDLALPRPPRVQLAPGAGAAGRADRDRLRGDRGHDAAGRGRRPRRRPHLPRAPAELRRRLRRHADRLLERRHDRLGDARDGGLAAKPARPAPGRPQPARLPALARLRHSLGSRPREDRARARRGRCQPTLVQRARPDRGVAIATAPPTAPFRATST